MDRLCDTVKAWCVSREEQDKMEEQRRQLDSEIERVLTERQKMVELQEVSLSWCC